MLIWIFATVLCTRWNAEVGGRIILQRNDIAVSELF